MKILGVIPARYNSKRFPGKPLVDILGLSMIQRVYKQCLKCELLKDIIVATDNIKVYNHVKQFNGNVIMSSFSHSNGTERCNEIVKKTKEKYDVIINIQGDQPYIHPRQINELAKIFSNKKVQIGTLAKKITNSADLINKNIVKVLFSKEDEALNFCRKTSNKEYMFKHIGIYGYRSEIINKICNLKPTKREKEEELEQLRWLENKYKIHICTTEYESISVDSPEDIIKIKEEMI